MPDWVTPPEEAVLICAMQMALETGHSLGLKGRVVMQHSLNRRRYNFRTRWLEDDSTGHTMPKPLYELIKRLKWDYGFGMDHVMANKYYPGGSIAPHMDAICFDNVIFSLSLGCEATLSFRKRDQGVRNLQLPPRSLLLMAGQARYQWRHSLQMPSAEESKDRPYGGVRWSLTFRKTIDNRGVGNPKEKSK